MFGFLPCVLRLGATMFYAVIIFTEVAGLHDFSKEEFAFFLIWLADEIFIEHSKYGFVPLFLAGFSFLIFCSCSSTKQVHTVPVENLHHDTLYKIKRSSIAST